MLRKHWWLRLFDLFWLIFFDSFVTVEKKIMSNQFNLYLFLINLLYKHLINIKIALNQPLSFSNNLSILIVLIYYYFYLITLFIIFYVLSPFLVFILFTIFSNYMLRLFIYLTHYLPFMYAFWLLICRNPIQCLTPQSTLRNLDCCVTDVEWMFPSKIFQKTSH